MGQVDDMDRGSPIDSGVGTAFDDVVMMTTSIENYRKLMKDQEDENRARLEGATEDYIGNAEAMALEDRYGGSAEGPMRFKLGRHTLRTGSESPH